MRKNLSIVLRILLGVIRAVIFILGSSIKFDNVYLFSWDVVSWSSVNLRIRFYLDYIRIIFLGSVRVIAGGVIIFSRSYISNEKYHIRFHILVLLFVGSIYLLIIRPRLIRILLGWDGLGVTSYLLVIYFQRSKAYNAGIITVLTNRVGDVLILLRIGVIIRSGRWFFYIYCMRCSRIEIYPMIVFSLIFIAAFTKRAQIPFSAWLPAAIAAPTPVSSLVHSSTLVTAGIYLVLRFQNFLLERGARKIIFIFGGITIIIAGIRALYEKDIKKIVALSTLRQLGLIIRRIGLGLWKIAFFHLLAHAYFKAILFIRVGNIIHNRSDYQDLRLIRLRRKWFNLTLRRRIVANIRLCGIPFIAAFYSKDMVMELFFLRDIKIVELIIIIVGVILTCMYTTRFIGQTIGGVSHETFVVEQVTDKEEPIRLSLYWLWPLAVTGGALIGWRLNLEPKRIVINCGLKNSTMILILIRFFLGVVFFRSYIKKWSKEAWSIGRIWSIPIIRRVVARIRFGKAGNTFRKGRDLKIFSDLFLNDVIETRKIILGFHFYLHNSYKMLVKILILFFVVILV